MKRIAHSIALLAFLLTGFTAVAQNSPASKAPQYKVDAAWPKALPNNWILGQVADVATDANDHIWIIHRPGTITDDEKGATLNPKDQSAAYQHHRFWNLINKVIYCKLGEAPDLDTTGLKMNMASI